LFFLTLLAFVIILGLLIFVHEFGHFISAKSAGVKVEEFAFGFPPRVICVKRGETKYCINAIPFGGYVKMLGEDRAADSPRSFSHKKPSRRFIISVAGVLMNFILAGVLFSVGYMIGMSPIRLDPAALDGKTVNEVVVSKIFDGSSAQKAGLSAGDVMLGFSSAEELSQFTKENAGKKVDFEVKRSGEIVPFSIQLSEDKNSPLGVGVGTATLIKLSFFKAIYFGFKDMIFTTGYILTLLWNIIVGLFRERKVAGEVAGPVGIFNLTGEAVKLGIVYLIQLAGLLSINLGLVNILPFPALDGGRAILILAEGIVRRKVIKEEIESILHTVGFAILIILISAITIKEIAGLF
jgi:regulator of sigma E protease